MRINTDRPEAMAYRGQDLTYVRRVTAADGPAYTPMIDQVIMKDSNGRELYFYANEIDVDKLSDDDKKAIDRADKKAQDASKEAEELAAQNTENKKKLFAGTKSGAKQSDEQKNENRNQGATGGIAGPEIPAHQNISGRGMQAETSPFNRVPGEPQRTAELDGAAGGGTGGSGPRTTDDGREIGRSGYPEGSGPDPQGRRVNEKDQSHSGTVERPAPRGDQS